MNARLANMMMHAVALAVLAAPATLATTPTPGVNLASGLVCQYDPTPAYDHCTDAGDPLQLTDGIYNGCSWTHTDTVGWSHADEVVIDIDLGAADAVGAVTFDTIAGSAGVTFPLAVMVFVSSDGADYYYLCDVINEMPPQTAVLNHRFSASDLKGWGRYVRVVVLAGGHYIFCDELEVMQGSHAEHETAYLDPSPVPAAGVEAYAVALRPWAVQKSTTLTLLDHAEDAVVERAQALGDPVLEAQSVAGIETIRTNVLNDAVLDAIDYTGGPPYRDHDLQAFELVGEANAQLWPGRDFVAWSLSSWTNLPPLDAPVGATLGAGVRVEMMNNEWAVASFVVTSVSDVPHTLSLSALDFTGPEAVAAAAVLRIAHVVHVEAYGFQYPDDAIVPLAEGPVVLQPGVSKRIWLTFKTRGMDLAPGLYTSTFTVASGGTVETVPLTLRVWPLRFPDRVTCESVSWGYFDDASLVGIETSAAQDLAEHYNTALVLNHRYLPKPVPDANGDLTEPLDFTKIDQMLAWNPDCRLWLLWVGFEFGFGRMGTGQFDTPVWENAFTQYVTQMRDHLASMGVGRNEFAWYWRDEPVGAQWTNEHMIASTTLKSIDPGMLVWADPAAAEMTLQEVEDALPYTDVMCPPMSSLWGGLLEILWQTRRPSWTYSSGSSKLADPFAYYRWFSWRAWKARLGGIGMWVYADERAQTFSDLTSGASFAMVYRGGTGVVGSKRWDAWREGIADYEYLNMLSNAVLEAQAEGVTGAALEQALDVLTAGVTEVVGSYPHNGDSDNRDLPAVYRLEALQALTGLRGIYTVYVATDGHEAAPTLDKIHAYDSGGGFLSTFDDPFPVNHLRWFDIERGPDNRLYTLSFNYDNVYRWNPSDGSYAGLFTSGGMNAPIDMAFGPDGNLYVVGEDVSMGVARYDGTTGAFIDKFADPGAVSSGVAFGPDGHLYVTTAAGNVLRFDGATGIFIDTFASGLGTWARKPVWRNGELHVAQGSRILCISSAGVNLGEFVAAGSGGLQYPRGFAWTPDGSLLVTSYITGGPNAVLRYDGVTGAPIDTFAAFVADEWPSELVIDVHRPRGVVIVMR